MAKPILLSANIPGVGWGTEAGVGMQGGSERFSLFRRCDLPCVHLQVPESIWLTTGALGGPCPGPVVGPTCVLSQRSSILPNKLEGWKGSKVQGTLQWCASTLSVLAEPEHQMVTRINRVLCRCSRPGVAGKKRKTECSFQ